MKWHNEQAPKWNKTPFTVDEDEAIKKCGSISWANWDLIASRLDTNRTPYACFERFQQLQKLHFAKRQVSNQSEP